MTTKLDIEYVSDIACPWCVIGLRNMEAAFEAIGGEIEARIIFSPFELNPDMPPEGMDRADYFRAKYRLDPETAKRRGGEIRDRAAETGFAMNTGEGFLILNTFDCHRLLHWAGEVGRQRDLKHALFAAYFSDGKDVSDAETLADIAASVGLDRSRAAAILAGDDYADAVRADEAKQRQRGIQSVPTIIVAGDYVINGGQSPAIFEKAFRHIAGELAKAVPVAG